MSSLPTTPLRVADFSGGLTENFIGGGPTRYMDADNFWVTVDKKLEERYGSQLYNPTRTSGDTNYFLPGNNQRIGALITFDAEQDLLVQANQYLWVLNTNWELIPTAGGNPAFSGGQVYNSMSWAEWVHHLLITNNSSNSTPLKVYRGGPVQITLPIQDQIFQTNGPTTWNAITAGLPLCTGNQNVSDAELLGRAIALAKELQGIGSIHTGSYGGSLGTDLHTGADGSFNFLYGMGGDVLPPVDLPTLIDFSLALAGAYEYHVSDALDVTNSKYHYTPLLISQGYRSGSFFNSSGGISYHLNNTYQSGFTSTLTTLHDVCALLDDIKTKLFLHQCSYATHDEWGDYTIQTASELYLGEYFLGSISILPYLGTISSGPVVTPFLLNLAIIANNLKAELNYHFSNNGIFNALTSQHAATDSNDYITFPNIQTFPVSGIDPAKVYALIDACTQHYVTHFYDSADQKFTYHYTSSNLQPTQDECLPRTQVTNANNSDLVAWAAQLNATITAFNAHTNAVPEHNVAGSTLNGVTATVPPSDPRYPPGGIYINGLVPYTPPIAAYSYAFHYIYQYQLYNGVIFQVVGPPNYLPPVYTEAILTSLTISDSASQTSLITVASDIQISNIPILSNGSLNNYDLTNTQVEIYRTIDSGTTYYLSGIVTNGTTTYTDYIPDLPGISTFTAVPNNQTTAPTTSTILVNGVLATGAIQILGGTLSTPIGAVPLIDQETIYTSGGVLPYDPAPQCVCLHILNGTAYYGGVYDSGQFFPNRVRQSIQNAIDSSPGSFYDDLDDTIVGISSTRNNLIIFCEHSVYVESGLFTPQGQGQMSHQRISDIIGCVGVASIVRTDVGIFFAGTDGFYYTDGYQLIKLSSELNLTYANLVSNQNQRQRIYGCYDRYNRRVWWSTQPDPSDTDVSKSYIFHVNFGVTAAGVFTTASNPMIYRPSAMVFWNGQQIRGDSNGYLYQHTYLSKTDPVYYNTPLPAGAYGGNTAVPGWITQAIPYSYASCSLDFGTTFQRKWTTRMSLQGKNVGNIAAQITSVSDNGRISPMAMKPIWNNSNFTWGNPNIIWGAPNSQQPIVWGNTPEIDSWRRFPATQMRSDFKQILIQPARIGVYQSESYSSSQGAYAYQNPNEFSTGVCAIILEPWFTNTVWPSDIIGCTYSSSQDGYVQEFQILGFLNIDGMAGTILSTTPTRVILVSDPNNFLAGSFSTRIYYQWVIRGVLKEQRLSMTSYNIHFTLLGKAQSGYYGPASSGENT